MPCITRIINEVLEALRDEGVMSKFDNHENILICSQYDRKYHATVENMGKGVASPRIKFSKLRTNGFYL